MVNKETTKYLILGNSAGGIGAAEAIREIDEAGVITIISDEPYPVYSRPLISEYLADRCSLDRMLYRPADFYYKNNIKTVLGDKATGIDFNERSVRLESGRTLNWKRLLLATGGLPIVPAMEGLGLQGIFTFTNLNDAKAIDQYLNRYGRRVKTVVIGGGLIGISVTEALVKRGIEVTIVEMKDRVLNTILDEEASTIEEKALLEAGVEIITDHTVNRINNYLPGETNSVNSVSLDDGRLIPCEIVIMAIGVRPRLELVSDSGIKINRGIVVDRHMETSIPNVYACGDVAEAYDFIYEENRLTPVWPNAYSGGRIAGLNMAGTTSEYQGGTAINSMKYFGINMVSAGMVTVTDDSYEVISIKESPIYKKVVLKEQIITGMVYCGDIEKAGIIYNLMKERVDVSSFKEALVAEDFGLASLPPEIWRAKLAIPPSEIKPLATSTEEPEEAVFVE